MKKTEISGDLKDPIGPARLYGEVKAQRNSQLVRDTILDLKARTATAKTAVTPLLIGQADANLAPPIDLTGARRSAQPEIGCYEYLP